MLEIVYILDMILKFMSTFEDPKTRQKVEEWDLIIENYKKNGFYRDFFTLLPLQLISLPFKAQNLFYVIKVIRLTKAIERFNISSMMSNFKRMKDRFVMIEVEYLRMKDSKNTEAKKVTELLDDEEFKIMDSDFIDEYKLRPFDQIQDFNRISTAVWVKNCIRTFSLFMMILGSAFFFGMFFRSCITLEKDFVGHSDTC
jgi:hypothetical protein